MPMQMDLDSDVKTAEPIVNSTIATTDDPYIGTLLAGRYRIQALLGVGGMGRVYKAHQHSVDRTVAVKILPTLARLDGAISQRFMQEAKATSRLNHPNTISILDFGQAEDASLYLAMEHLTGMTLEEAAKAPLPVERVLKIAIQICGSLAEAHRKSIVHRDLKPANIFLTSVGDNSDWVKVLDFGIAKFADSATKLTVKGMITGTPEYMSPEQIKSEQVDERADIYSLGVLIYQLLTGTIVFHADTPMSVMYAHVHDAPKPFSSFDGLAPIPEELEIVVMQMLNKNPSDRPQDVREVAATLTRILKRDVLREFSIPAASARIAETLPIGQSSVVPQPEVEGSPQTLATDEIALLSSLAKYHEGHGELLKASQFYQKIAAIYIEYDGYRLAIDALKCALALVPHDERSRQMLEHCYIYATFPQTTAQSATSAPGALNPRASGANQPAQGPHPAGFFGQARSTHRMGVTGLVWSTLIAIVVVGIASLVWISSTTKDQPPSGPMPTNTDGPQTSAAVAAIPKLGAVATVDPAPNATPAADPDANRSRPKSPKHVVRESAPFRSAKTAIRAKSVAPKWATSSTIDGPIAESPSKTAPDPALKPAPPARSVVPLLQARKTAPPRREGSSVPLLEPNYISRDGQWSGARVAHRGCTKCHAQPDWHSKTALDWQRFFERGEHRGRADLKRHFSTPELERLQRYLQKKLAR